MRYILATYMLCACSEYNLNEKAQPEPGQDTAIEEDIPLEQPPVAVSGPSVQVKREALIQLDGSGSYDPDDEMGALTYFWEISSSPEGSAPFLDDPTSAQPYLFADILGEYVVTLTVTDQTGLSSVYPAATMVTVIPYEDLMIELTWDIDQTDLDLHLVAPEGTYYSVDDCFYGNPNPDWGVVNDRTDNPTLSFDDEGSERRESITYLQPFDGIYSVYALYYRNLGADYPYVTPHITIYAEGNVIADFDGPRLTTESSVWHIGDLDWSTLNFEMKSDVYDHVDLGGPEYD